jgi:hypothetical protein
LALLKSGTARGCEANQWHHQYQRSNTNTNININININIIIDAENLETTIIPGIDTPIVVGCVFNSAMN